MGSFLLVSELVRLFIQIFFRNAELCLPGSPQVPCSGSMSYALASTRSKAEIRWGFSRCISRSPPFPPSPPWRVARADCAGGPTGGGGGGSRRRPRQCGGGRGRESTPRGCAGASAWVPANMVCLWCAVVCYMRGVSPWGMPSLSLGYMHRWSGSFCVKVAVCEILWSGRHREL